MFEFLYAIVFFVAIILFFTWFMGYRQGNIVLQLDERYIDFNEYIKAVKEELKREGHDVQYEGNRYFLIDGERYLFLEKNLSMEGVPLQQTVLKKIKVKKKKEKRSK